MCLRAWTRGLVHGAAHKDSAVGRKQWGEEEPGRWTAFEFLPRAAHVRGDLPWGALGCPGLPRAAHVRGDLPWTIAREVPGC